MLNSRAFIYIRKTSLDWRTSVNYIITDTYGDISDTHNIYPQISVRQKSDIKPIMTPILIYTCV